MSFQEIRRWTLAVVIASCSLGMTGQMTFTQDTLFFPPTTIDSTVTLQVTVQNDLTVTQIATFSGIGAPLTLQAATAAVPAMGTHTIDVTFSPISVNDFSSDLTVTGDVFGEDVLHIVAEGALPQGTLLTDTLDFGAVSVNSTATEYLEIASVGIGSLFVSSIESPDPVFSAMQEVIIPQGETAAIPVTFFSELSGNYAADLVVHTSDPFTPTHLVHCKASAISQVSGSVCGNWSAVNSPYLLQSDLLVPSTCSLTIEPGVYVDLNGYRVIAEGELISQGTAAQPVVIENGQIELQQEVFNAEHTSFSNNASLNLVNRESVYFNDFEDGNQPFYCYSDNWGGNDSGDGIYHCDRFDNYQSEVWSSNGVRCLRHHSNDYNGYMVLTSAVSNLESGLYQWSFLYKNEQFDLNSQMRVYYEVNGGGWNQFYASPLDGYALEQEQFAGFSEFFEVPEEGSVNIRFEHYISSTSSCYDQAKSYIDDLRLDRVEQLPVESLLFSNQATLGGSSTASSNGAAVVGASSAYGAVGTAIQLQTGVGQATAYWISRPIAVNSNRLFVDFYEKRTTADQNCWYYTHVRVNGGEWKLLRDQRDQQCGDGSMGTHDWEHRFFIIEDLSFGDQVEFRLQIEAFDIGNPIYRDVTMLIDEFRIREDFSQPVAIESNGTTGISMDHCTVVGDIVAVADSCQIDLTHSNIEGLYVEGNETDLHADSTFIRNIDLAYSNTTGFLNNCVVENETGNGIYMGTEANLHLFDCTIQNCGGSGLTVGSNSTVELDYSFLLSNGGDGAELGLGSTIYSNNSLVAYNLGFGINSAGSAVVDYSVLRGNGKQGLSAENFSTVDNSILWFNDGVPQMSTSNVYAISYSNVQGINALLTSESFAWGDGCIGTDPVFADSLSILDAFSPCVDGGKPWEQDAHIPFGLGSSRADMGLYGGPQNAFWGGQEPPNGAVQITDIFDIPNDDGGYVGLHFEASPFDFGGLGFNVTHYSIWRDLGLGESGVIDLSDGNWEEIGEVPAQGFSQYGYTAASLIDYHPDVTDCLTNFIVIAHTNDENIYWISEVAAVCSVDNLAPDPPMLTGELVQEGANFVAQLSWDPPVAEDYAYTELIGSNGFYQTVYGDTVTSDAALFDPVITYYAVHFDLNGNSSDTSQVMLEISSIGPDLIPLVSGWNLVSSERLPDNTSIEAVVASLQSGNLEYVTGFADGAQFYDPDGLLFLNTLEEWLPGYGYWLKVLVADTLQVPGEVLDPSFLPPLQAGWNLIAYPPLQPSAPEVFFAEMIADENLDYVTGYNQGFSYYDPNGLPFLNSLTALQNGFGYWLKLAETAGLMNEVVNGQPTADTQPPAYDFLNGQLASGVMLTAGTVVEAVDAESNIIGTVPIVQGRYLMTTALHLNKATSTGDIIRFRLGELWAEETIVWEGNQSLHQVVLTFPGLQAAVGYPNPTSGPTTFSLILVQQGVVRAEVTDARGQVVAMLNFGDQPAGEASFDVDLDDLTSAIYNVQFYQHDLPIQQLRVAIQKD